MEIMSRVRSLGSALRNRSGGARPTQLSSIRASVKGEPGHGAKRPAFRRLASAALTLGLVLGGSSFWTGTPAEAATGGMISVTLDDGWASQYNNALPVLNKYGVPATMYIISGSVNDVPLYMTQAQIQAFASRGDEIAGHTVTHPDLTTLTATQRNNELSQSKATLQQMFGPTAAIDFASPYGAYNATTTAAVKNYYATQRNTDDGFNARTGFDPYNILVQSVVSTTSTATVQGWINSAKANNTWLVLVYHEVGANVGGDIYHTDTAAFDAHLAAVKNSGLPLVTVRQGVQALTSSTTTAPAAPTGVTATAGNTSATVNWTAPANGGSPITSYTVTPRTGTTNLTPVTVSGNPPATGATITGLTNGAAYTFTVTATNAVGTSAASPASNSVTPAAAATGGMVSVALDDGWASQYNNGLPVLNKYGVPATMYIISGSVNDVPLYMTQAQIQAFANRGDEIASHTVTHADLTTLTATQRNNELSQSKATLQQMFGPTAAIDFASPYGAYNATTTAAVKNYYASQRNTDGGFNARTGFDPYNIQVQNVVSTTSAATVQGWVNSAKANNTWLVLVYHEVGANLGGDIYHTDTAVFDAHLAAVKNSGLRLVTVRQGVQAFASSSATAPAAPQGVTATAGNGSATVAWNAPNNGGSAITSYTVTPRTGTTNLTPVTVTGNPPATGTTVTGLTNGTAYTFTVTATNAVGTSPASAASGPVTPAAATSTAITNGGFESGLTAWTTGGARAPVASSTAHTGTGSALLGLTSGPEPLGDSSLAQTITVPATGTTTLSFWYQPHTVDEICNGTACRYDWSEAQIRSSSGTVLRSLFKLASNSGTWTRVTADLSAYRGQSITLWFNVHLEGAVPADDTWMYLDDVTVTTS
jgi:peptidoglycan/xylan/chitin deacetylase (PgdA/CDA1 family)